MGKEIWKDIKGYEGFYQVSSLGRIRSIAVRRNICGKTRIINRERVLKPTDNGYGYLMVHLKSNNNITPKSVHRIVAETFLNKEDGFDCVNHIDHDTHNNSVENLEWCTQRHNVNHSAGRMQKPKSTKTTSNTGEKYICFTKGKYQVALKRFGIWKRFDLLEDAIRFRDKCVSEHADYFEKGVV
jgi:hypothetical protein